MANNDANRKPPGGRGWWWVIGIPGDGSGWLSVQGRTKSGQDLGALDIQVRVGQSPSGRLFVTGLRIGAPEGKPAYEVKSLRDIHLGEILAQIREAAALGGGRALGPDLRGNAQAAGLTIRRGPIPDFETDERTLAIYEAKLAAGLSKTVAIAQTSMETHRSQSQAYRRLSRARKARQEKGVE